jgi:nucleotide-binding universal stress UspA family protein
MSLLHLVGHDGTSRGDDALALSRALARDDQAQRLIVRVLLPATPDRVPSMALRTAIHDAAEEELAPVRAGLRPGEELRLVEASSVAHGLHDLAEQTGAALIVVGSSHRGKVMVAVLGTVADRLLHGSPCPVAQAADGFAAGEHAIGRVLLAYDGSEEADGAFAFAEASSRDADAPVDVVCVQEAPNYFDYTGTGGIPPALLDEPQARAARIAERAAERLPAGHVGSVLTPLWPTGKAITSAAAGADLIVTGSRAYGPLRHVALGSTGHYLLHHAPCSVVVVPRGAGGVGAGTEAELREQATA